MNRFELAGFPTPSIPTWPSLVRSSLAEASTPYPNFDEWFWSEVVPYLGDTRSIFIEQADGGIRGIVIAKREFAERKLCTVWVDPLYRGRGIANRLMDDAVDWLGTDSPMLTVPGTAMTGFRTLIASRNFVQTQCLKDYYRTGIDEYVFNGRLPTKSPTR